MADRTGSMAPQMSITTSDSHGDETETYDPFDWLDQLRAWSDGTADGYYPRSAQPKRCSECGWYHEEHDPCIWVSDYEDDQLWDEPIRPPDREITAEFKRQAIELEEEERRKGRAKANQRRARNKRDRNRRDAHRARRRR